MERQDPTPCFSIKHALAPRVVSFLILSVAAALATVGTAAGLLMLVGAGIMLCAVLLALSARSSTRSLRFSLRTTLLLTTFLCIALAWIVSRQREQMNLARIIEKAGGSVQFAGQDPDEHVAFTEQLLRLILGDEYGGDIVDVSLIRADINDEDLSGLRYCTKLRRLDLDYSSIGDETLQYLEGLDQLEWLDVEDTRVTDEGIKSIARLRPLRQLILDDNPITDAGIAHLQGMKKLVSLRLLKTQVTPAGIKLLEIALPECRIEASMVSQIDKQRTHVQHVTVDPRKSSPSRRP